MVIRLAIGRRASGLKMATGRIRCRIAQSGLTTRSATMDGGHENLRAIWWMRCNEPLSGSRLSEWLRSGPRRPGAHGLDPCSRGRHCEGLRRSDSHGLDPPRLAVLYTDRLSAYRHSLVLPRSYALRPGEP